MRGAVLLFFLALLGCEARLTLGASCDFNSDCDPQFVCRHQRCRTACLEARDCPIGLRCVSDAMGASACTLPVETSCDETRPCPGALVCEGGECRSECTTPADCTAGGSCQDGSCVEPLSGSDAGVPGTDAGPPAPDAACTPSPMICGNGELETCDGLESLAQAITGGTSPELFLVTTHTLPAVTWPTRGSVPLEPEVALGISRLGFGVVAQIGSGESREVLFRSFPLDAFTAAAPSTIDRVDYSPPEPPLTNALSLVLAEHGNEVHAFILDVEPPGPSMLSGHRVIFGPGASGTERGISSGDPVARSGGHMAIVGGASSVLGGAALPLYYVTRELVPEATEVSALGAIDEPLGFSSYRSIDVGAFSSAPFLEVVGSAGSVVLVRDGGETIGLWNVERTAALETFTDGMRPMDLVTADVDALGTPGFEATRPGGIDYLLAVPTAGGVTRFWNLVCPAIGLCNAPSVRSGDDLPTRSTRTALEAHLASLPGGAHALLTREPGAGGTGAILDLRILGADLRASAVELPAPLLTPTPDPARRDVVAATLRAVTDGFLTTIVVAVLVRDFERREDQVILYGLRACTAR